MPPKHHALRFHESFDKMLVGMDFELASASGTNVNLSQQEQQYALDEKEIEQFYRDDQRLIGESIEKKSDQDRQAEASFERMWQSTQPPNISTKRRVEVSTGEEADYGLFKKRLYDIWSSLGKPLIEFENIPGSTIGRWEHGRESDYITPYKMKKPPAKKPFSWENFEEQKLLSLLEKYQSRYGGMTDQNITFETSPEGRKDKIFLKKGHRKTLETLVQELAHQMQGRKLYGKDLHTFNRKFAHQQQLANKRGFRKAHSDPTSLEYQAHNQLAHIMFKALKGDKESLGRIKSRNY